MKRFVCFAIGAACLTAALGPIHSLALPVTAYAAAKGPVGPGAGISDVTYPKKIGPDSTGLDNDTYTRKQEVGPGMQEENSGDTSLLPTVAVPNDFLNKNIADPIVRPADKYSFAQMEADIRSLQERYGNRLQVNVMGSSHDGRALYELVVGNPNAPKHVLFQGAMHGREYMTPLLLMSQVEMALANYDSGHYNGKALSNLFDQVALHVVPMSNPDGVTISQFGIGGIWTEQVRQAVLSAYASDVALERTGRSLEEYLRYWKANGMGIDLNQNYPALWEELTTTATAPSYAGYKGASPLSEPENQALQNLTESRQWSAVISYHSMGNIIYWDTSGNQAGEQSKALAQSVSSVTGYRLNNSLGKGGYKDWIQTKSNPIPGITIEVGSVSCPMPLSEFQPVWKQNKGVWAQVMDFVAD